MYHFHFYLLLFSPNSVSSLNEVHSKYDDYDIKVF